MATSASPPSARPWITALVFAVIGAWLLVGGIWLLVLGGSPYYAVSGAATVLSAGLLWARRRAGAWLYGVVWLGTAVWSLFESGLNFWYLEPRLLVPTLLLIWLWLPPVQRKLVGAAPRASRQAATAIVCVAFCVFLGGLAAGAGAVHAPQSDGDEVHNGADSDVPDADWPFYGRTPRGDRFTPLDQITTANVSKLEPAWTYRTGDLPYPTDKKNHHEFNFEATPIKIGDSLYLCTPHSHVIALDPVTGKARWTFDPHADTSENAYVNCRGVSYYRAPAGTDCPERIIAPVADARLVALDARTGKPCEGFGEHGFVSLTQYLAPMGKGFHFVSSPPLVIKDRVILGGWIYDGQAENEPSGAVRAFDPITGALVWAWDVGKPGEVAHPDAGDVLTRGTPNAWGVYTADEALGLVYLPTGNAVPDYYGANRRPFDEKYSSSVVALDIESGAPRWHFQTLHHDLWDMDVPIGPSLVDLPDGAGHVVPALVQTTKRGELFLLDRRDGHPLAEVTEKPAPQDGLPGDHVAPTQPYSVGMPSFAPPRIRERDAWGATMLDQLVCRIQFRSMHYEGAYTPITTRKTLVYPAFDGIVDWQGGSIDPVRHWLVVNTSFIPFVAQSFPRKKPEQSGDIPTWNGQGTPPHAKDFEWNPQYGTPYATKVEPWLNPLGVPCKAPPWGQMAAVDLTSRRIVWQHDVGTTRDTGPFGLHVNLPLPTGIFNIGGNIITAGGLVFMGATADDYLRAFDIRTGKELWRARLPAGGQATPMSYEGADGRQYIVISAGGHGGLRTRSGDYVVAYALPASRAPVKRKKRIAAATTPPVVSITPVP